MFNKPEITINFEEYKDLQSVSELSNKFRAEIKQYLYQWTDESENDIIFPSWMQDSSYSKGEVFRHLLVHEVHHIGQLSIWARELGITPPSPNFIGRNFMDRAKDMKDSSR
ncbi:DinB family protein [compost metagenome]